MTFDQETLTFLADLEANNNRDWFAANKPRYETANARAKACLSAVVDRMNEGDDIQKAKLYRIYRDVRFSKNKTPYNPRFGMSLSRRKPHLRGGYFISVMASGASVSAGFWGPNSGDLALIRGAIDRDGDRFRAEVEGASVSDIMGPLKGESLKTAPRGFSVDHADIDLLRRKQFLFSRALNTETVLSKDFADEIVFSLRSVRPFFDYMSDLLSRNLDGEPSSPPRQPSDASPPTSASMSLFEL